MKKTTVYLSDEEWDSLRRAAAETGRSQSALIRDGVRRVTRTRTRRFRSMAMGEGTGEPVGRRVEELLATALKPRR